MKIKLGNNEYEFPNKWEDLNPHQYLLLCKQLQLFMAGLTSVDEVRAMWFCSMADIEFKSSDSKNDLFWENIYRISNQFNFFLRIEYEKPLRSVPKELRKKLYRYLPDEVNSTDNILRWVKSLNHKYIIDADFAKNLLPAVSVKDKSYYGYKFELKGKMLLCSLTAKQFVTATEALDIYMNDQNDDHLCALISVLYGNGENPDAFKNLDATQKFAVLLNFQSIVAFITKRTRYSIIWNRSNKKLKQQGENKITVGVGDSIYSLAKIGYGNIDEIGGLNLIQYLDLLLKNIVDSVTFLHDNEKNVAEIAEQTGLTIQQIQKII